MHRRVACNGRLGTERQTRTVTGRARERHVTCPTRLTHRNVAKSSLMSVHVPDRVLRGARRPDSGRGHALMPPRGGRAAGAPRCWSLWQRRRRHRRRRCRRAWVKRKLPADLVVIFVAVVTSVVVVVIAGYSRAELKGGVPAPSSAVVRCRSLTAGCPSHPTGAAPLDGHPRDAARTDVRVGRSHHGAARRGGWRGSGRTRRRRRRVRRLGRLWRLRLWGLRRRLWRRLRWG